MNSQENKPQGTEARGRETNNDPASVDPRPQGVAKKNSEVKAVTWFLTLLALTLLGVGGIIYYRTMVLNQNVTASLVNFSHQTKWNQHQISDLQNEFSQLQQRLQQQDETLRRQTQVLQEWQALTQKGPSTRGRDHGAILNAQYFVKLANDQLLLTKDVSQALSFLDQAQNELKEVVNPQVLPLKAALTQDISRLKNAPWVNTTNLYLSLFSLQHQVEKLPLLVVPVQNSEKPDSGTSTEQLSSWEKGLRQLWGALRQMVVVYHLPATQTPPFITPDQRPYIYENVRATLSDASWAVLHHDSDIYRSNLQQAADWVSHYFSMSSPLTKTFINQLQALQAVSIQPPKEIVLVSPQAFQEYLKTESAAAS